MPHEFPVSAVVMNNHRNGYRSVVTSDYLMRSVLELLHREENCVDELHLHEHTGRAATDDGVERPDYLHVALMMMVVYVMSIFDLLDLELRLAEYGVSPEEADSPEHFILTVAGHGTTNNVVDFIAHRRERQAIF